MNDHIPKRWAGGICIHDGNVLLIYRVNKDKDFDQEYFVFPGAQERDDESLEDTILREFKNCSITVKVGELFYSTEENDNDEADYYYICEYILGEPLANVDSDEVPKMKESDQLYTPMWVPLDQLDDLIVYPETVKNKVLFELADES